MKDRTPRIAYLTIFKGEYMTRGNLLEALTLMYPHITSGPLYTGPSTSSNSLVSITGGPRNCIYVDGRRLDTTGFGDEREVPLDYAHWVVAIINTVLEKPAPINRAMVELMERVREKVPEDSPPTDEQSDT